VASRDKSWGSGAGRAALDSRPDPAPIEAEVFGHGTVRRSTYQARFLGKGEPVAPGEASFETKDRGSSVRERVSTIGRGYEGPVSAIKRFSLMIEWGWFWMITQPRCSASGRDLQSRRNFFGASRSRTPFTVLVRLAFFPSQSLVQNPWRR